MLTKVLELFDIVPDYSLDLMQANQRLPQLTADLFSGMDTHSLIQQLLQVESRPKILAQRRVIQLQQTQAAYLDLNSKLSALKTAAGAFRVNNTFKTNKAVSTNPDAMTATASTAALPGQYTFIVDRLVSTQKLLSRGFASSTSGLNAGSFTFEPETARLPSPVTATAITQSVWPTRVCRSAPGAVRLGTSGSSQAWSCGPRLSSSRRANSVSGARLKHARRPMS
jgi:hypothetical protein